MKKITLSIDGKQVTAAPGKKLLRVALENGIYIPNLCALREKEEPPASCRLCFVEVAGKDRPVTACTTEVAEGMAVNTSGEKARRLAGTAFALLMASHPVDCAHCLSNGNCELQKIARHLKIPLKTKRFQKLLRHLAIDESNPLFAYDPNKCVLCGRCVRVCREHPGNSVLGFARRGFLRVVTTFGDEPIGSNRCLDCGQCVTVCPTGALAFKDGSKARKAVVGAGRPE